MANSGLELGKEYCFVKKILIKFFKIFIVQPHSFNSQQKDRQISSVLIIRKLPHFGKTICEKWKLTNFWFMGSRN